MAVRLYSLENSPKAARHCNNCGANIGAADQFCMNCGVSVNGTVGNIHQNTSAPPPPAFTPQGAPPYYPGQYNPTPPMATNPHAAVVSPQEQATMAYIEDQDSRSSNYFLGFLGSLLGALIGAIPQGLVASTGWFVGWLGFLIAIASSKAYDLCKVKTNMIKFWCVLASIIIGVIFGQAICELVSGQDIRLDSEGLAWGYAFAFLGGISVLIDIRKKAKLTKKFKSEMSYHTMYR